MDARKFTSVFLLIVTVFLSLVHKGLCIKCYKCNSKIHGDECTDLPNIAEDRKVLYEKNCDNERDVTRNYTYCRKIIQEVGDDVRIIRQCGSAGSGECVYKTGSNKIRMTYCECKSKPLCNQGNSIQIPHVITGFLVSTYIFIFRIFH